MRLALYRHNRRQSITKSVGELYQFIETISNKKSMKAWYKWFEQNCGLSETATQQYFKKSIADNFDWVNLQAFTKKYCLRSLLLDIAVYPAFLLYIWIKRQLTRPEPQKFSIMFDHIEDHASIKRFETLINLFGRENTLVLVPGTQIIEMPGVTFINGPQLINYRIEFMELLLMLRGITTHILYSYKTGTNLVRMAISILNTSLYWRTIFESFECNYCLMYQHYHSNAIKNDLFKKNGGRISATVQKNLHWRGGTGFYYDFDLFFSLGTGTANQSKKLGARLDEVLPVGSLFMEHYFVTGGLTDHKKIWDIVIMGGNEHYPGSMCDTYDTHNADYEEGLHWIWSFSKKYPMFRIGFKHHSNYNNTPLEKTYFSGCNVKMIDQTLCSYSLGFQSNVVLTWASTILFELRAYQIPGFFIDPGSRNGQFVESTESWSTLKLTTYNRFETALLYHLSETGEFRSNEEFCLDSHVVSKRIFQKLQQKQ